LPLMKVKDIKPGMENIYLTANVVTLGNTRTVDTRYGSADVAIAIIEDETGRLDFKLWRDQIRKVRVGDTIKIENAFAVLFDGKTELNVGSRGQLVVVRR
jgi:replication factor A1